MVDLLGLPPQDEERYTTLAKDLLRELGDEQPALRAYLLELLTERRNTLRPGLITSLLDARLDGQPLHQEDVLGICGQLFLGSLARMWRSRHCSAMWYRACLSILS